ncbi:MAG: hypothetical protein FWH01_03175 [Oscillospiraceae bacterium]|nr:hypothetical protein [Oscillospiraceae bacterium]
MAGNSVGFKANANGLVVVFDENESFESICEQISRKLESGGFFFQTRYLAASYKGRKLTPDEEGQISRMMAEKTGARTVLFEIDKDFDKELRRSAKSGTGGEPSRYGAAGGLDEALDMDDEDSAADNPAAMAPGGDTAAFPNSPQQRPLARRRYMPIDLDECMTKYHRGTLRSGRLVSYDGNVVVIGDVNPGAEVEATGNIIILGNVKGIVHAGAGGNKEATVIALNFAPTQLRVADVITRRAERHVGASSGNAPEIAYLKGDSIIIEPLLSSR